LISFAIAQDMTPLPVLEAPPPPPLLDQVRDRLRTEHYSIRTESQYVFWIRRFILIHGERYPRGPQHERREGVYGLMARLLYG